jgi:hypothetical protein
LLLLYADETLLWRFALLRRGWWRCPQRYRLPTRTQWPRQIRREETLKRHAWLPYRSWRRITSGVLLSVIGAVQFGTSKVFYKVVSHFDAQELRHYIHQGMAALGKTGKEVVMVVDRSGIHRAPKLSTSSARASGAMSYHLPAQIHAVVIWVHSKKSCLYSSALVPMIYSSSLAWTSRPITVLPGMNL